MYLLSPSDDKLARKMEQSLREVRAEYEAMGGCSSLSRARPGFQKLFAEMELGTKQLQGEKDSKPTFLVVGKTGSGKSSLINALTKVHMAEVGTGPQTGGATAFDGKELGTFIDTPGWSEEGCPKELRSRNAWRQHNDATRLKTLREVVERYRPDGIIYCVTPATLNSQEIAEDLQRLVGIKNLVDSITGVRSSLLAILTKADTDLGPRVVKDSAEHHRLTHRRLRTVKETIKHFQMLNPGSPATSSLRPVAICSCVAKYKLIDGQPDFCSCDVSKVREEMQADSKLVSTVRKAHLEALEKQSISTGNSVIWYHAVLSVFLSYLPFLDVLMCYANLEKMLRLLSFTSPGAGRGACREKNKFACYKADFLCMSLFVTTIRLLALLVAVMIPFKTNAFFPWVTPCMVVVFTVVIGALLNGLTTLHIGYAALHDFCDSHSLLALMITALRDRYSGKQFPSDVYTPLSPVAFECMEQKPKLY